MNRLRPTFSETVRSARKTKQLSQTQLAEQAGVSRVTVTRIERDQGVHVDSLLAVFRVLGYTLEVAELGTEEVGPSTNRRGT